MRYNHEGGGWTRELHPGAGNVSISCLQLYFKFCGFCLYGKTERIYIWERSTYEIEFYLFLIIRVGYKYGCYQS